MYYDNISNKNEEKNDIVIPAQAGIHVSKWHCAYSEMDPSLRWDDSTGLEAILV